MISANKYGYRFIKIRKRQWIWHLANWGCDSDTRMIGPRLCNRTYFPSYKNVSKFGHICKKFLENFWNLLQNGYLFGWVFSITFCYSAFEQFLSNSNYLSIFVQLLPTLQLPLLDPREHRRARSRGFHLLFSKLTLSDSPALSSVREKEVAEIQCENVTLMFHGEVMMVNRCEQWYLVFVWWLKKQLKQKKSRFLCVFQDPRNVRELCFIEKTSSG